MLRTTHGPGRAALNVVVLIALLASLLAPAIAFAQDGTPDSEMETAATEPPLATEPPTVPEEPQSPPVGEEAGESVVEQEATEDVEIVASEEPLVTDVPATEEPGTVDNASLADVPNEPVVTDWALSLSDCAADGSGTVTGFVAINDVPRASSSMSGLGIQISSVVGSDYHWHSGEWFDLQDGPFSGTVPLVIPFSGDPTISGIYLEVVHFSEAYPDGSLKLLSEHVDISSCTTTASPPAPPWAATISIDSVSCTEGGGRIAGTVSFSGRPDDIHPSMFAAIVSVDGTTPPNLGGYHDMLVNYDLAENPWFDETVLFDLAFPRLNQWGEQTNGQIRIAAGPVYGGFGEFQPLAVKSVDVSACFDPDSEEPPITPVPTEEPGPTDVPTITGFTMDMPDACSFTGGTATLTGTTQFSRAIADDELLWIDLWIGWGSSSGSISWVEGHWGPNSAYWHEPLSINGPWSLSMTAYDPELGSSVFGRERPPGAHTLVATLVVSGLGGADADETTLTWSLDDCGEPEPTDPPVTPVVTETPVVTVPPIVTETPVSPTIPVETPTDVPVTEVPATEPPIVDGAAVPVSLAICADVDCTPPYRTDADGFTATWEFSQDAEDRQAIRSFFQAEQGTVTVSAVIQNGMATATSPILATGTWNACLQPVLTRADGAMIRLLDAPQCDKVTISADGDVAAVATNLPASADLVIEGEPASPASPAEPTAPAATPGTTTEPSIDSGGGASSGSVTHQTAAGLPVTGTGQADMESSVLTVLAFLATASVLSGAALLLRRHSGT